MDQLQRQLQATLGEAFRLERELTGGGMSRVFVAEETALGRKVVVKALPADSKAPVSVERFKREIALAAQLQHPHIVPLLTAGDAGGIPYFTMPYVRGESLRTRLTTRGELPVTEAVRILRQVASALAFAHDAGVVHRDIKPDNVLISGDAAMVTDFGVAKALSASTVAGDTGLTSLGVALGTPAYMSPEQASADPHIDHRSDIYSWGVLAYELLTGSTPFTGRPSHALLAAHASETPETITQRRPNMPAPLAALVMRCLEKRAADRPQRAHELVQALDEMSTTSGGSPPAIVTTRTMSRRSVGLVAGGAGAVLVAAAVWMLTAGAAPAASSVGVLPLDVGGDTALAYLTDGLTDRLSADLQRRGIRVAPLSSVYAIGPNERDPRAIAKKLNVASVFIGRARARGNQLDVTYDLVSADGTTLVQDAHDANVGDSQALRDQILQNLLGVLTQRNGDRAAQTVHREVSTDVYDLYLRALHVRKSFTKEGIEHSIELFKQAIARDSTYAPLYSDLGWTYMQLADGYYPPREVIPQATAAVERALMLDDSLAQAHTALAALYQQYLFNWDGTTREADRALALNPDNAEAHFWRAANQGMRGDWNASVESMRRALDMDPLSVFMNYGAVWFYALAGLPDSAISRFHRVQELAPGMFYLDTFVDDAYRMKGQLDSAVAISEWGSKKAGRPLGGQVLNLVQLGRRAEAQRVFSELESVAATSYIPPEILARSALALGDKEKCITYLEKGADAQSALVQSVMWYPEYRQLIGHPRFERYLERVHLAEIMHKLSGATAGSATPR